MKFRKIYRHMNIKLAIHYSMSWHNIQNIHGRTQILYNRRILLSQLVTLKVNKNKITAHVTLEAVKIGRQLIGRNLYFLNYMS